MTDASQLHLSLKLPSLIVCAGLVASSARAQPTEIFPAWPVQIILCYSAGGKVDTMARAFASDASSMASQQRVVANCEGAGGVVGLSLLAKAKPDGHKIAFSPASPLTNPLFLHINMRFKGREIEPVCQGV